MSSKYYRILSLDGGGIRGVIPGQILVTLEKKIQERAQDSSVRLADYFDLVAGTSTGGILAAAMLMPSEEDASRPRFTSQEVVDLYFERGGEIFNVDFWHKVKTLGGITDEKYPSDGIENALKDYFGDTRLKELLLPTLITSYDIKRRKGHFFRQHRAQANDAYDFSVFDVCRSTSAAPTYFELNVAESGTGIHYPLIDGGVFVNNPSLCAYSEARVHSHTDAEHRVTAKDMVLVSIGTGLNREPYDADAAEDYGAVQWIKPVIDIMMSGVADTVDFQLGQIFSAAGVAEQYFRINTPIPRDVDTAMDNAGEENMRALRELGTETAQKSDQELNRIVDFLFAE